MGNSLRCCLACVLPCGALDLVRIVHINGHVEEYSRAVFAGEILDANPNHVISKPCSQGAVSRRIMIVSPDSELKRGKIYFLIPASAFPERKKKKITSNNNNKKKKEKTHTATSVRFQDPHNLQEEGTPTTEEKKTGHHHHRRRKSGRVAIWRPHLESIYED